MDKQKCETRDILLIIFYFTVYSYLVFNNDTLTSVQ